MELILQHLNIEKAFSLNVLQSAIIRTLLYSDIFNYPLTLNELLENCQMQSSVLPKIEAESNRLIAVGLIESTNGFFHIKGKQEQVALRRDLNKRAEKALPISERMSKLISRFPFVEGVLITGSLAKNCLYEDGDIDYLIVTRPGRLWLCRGLLTAFKKIFLLDSRKYFCVNYYLDADSLTIPDRNIFTATEIIFAKAAYNAPICETFFKSNQWIFDYYPNRANPKVSQAGKQNDSLVKSFFEIIFSGWLGEKSDDFLFKLFVRRWRRKFGHLDATSFEVNFRSKNNVSKHHPNGFQFKVLAQFEEKIRQFETEHQLKLL